MTGGKTSGEVFIVDDDPMVRDVLSEVFAQAGYRATGFADGASFVAAARQRIPACVILDIYMPGCSGLEILKDIDAPNFPAPIFVASGRGDIPSAVEAIKSGAFDFIEKRLDADTIVGRVRAAIDRWEHRRQNDGLSERALPLLPGYDLLTDRERQVLFQITSAASIKETSRNLGISPRTVAVHRRHIMRKLSVRGSVNLMRAVLNKARSV